MVKIAVIGRVRAEGLRLLEEQDEVEVALLDGDRPEAFVPHVTDADAILVRTNPLPASVIDAAPRLKVVSRHGVGYDNVDVGALNRRRIPLAISASANMVSVAEHAFAMMLALVKDLAGRDRAVRAGDWAYRHSLTAGELAGATLLLVGFGRIGQALARRAVAFGMRVRVFDPYVTDDLLDQMGCERAPLLDASLHEADVVSLHVPLTEHTRHLIDAGRLALMKESAVLINTARGGLVDEAALALALKCGRLKGAGIDAFACEPPKCDNPLLKLENVILTPHAAGVTEGSMLRMALEAASNILAVLDGRLDPAVIVNYEAVSGQHRHD
ncbi:MAG: hydroxyacid dehydrogenase [Geminicoccaceae bacterium]|nr:hydroxyacid dehydrogenase [Geminicoccaceae bacterium]